jgi:phosphatidate cytidylyltransferase
MSKEFYKRFFSSIIMLIVLFFFLKFNNFLFLISLLLIFIGTLREIFTIINSILFKFFGFIFVSFSYLSFYQIKLIDNEINFFLLLIMICIMSDIGGYIFGKLLGGPKLTKLSPKKTLAGSFGSFFLSFIFIFFYFKYLNLDLLDNKFYYLFPLIISFVSQIGDLSISFLKRKAGVKNTGNLIPGHGGILDRIDGMLFVFPFFYLINFFFSFA